MAQPSLLVLLVEDNEGYSYLTRRLLLQINPALDVQIAKDGQEAMTFIQLHRPQLVLLDLELPTLSGLELLHALKRREETSSIPAVVLTAYADAQRVWSAYQQLANAVLIKPEQPEGLHETLVALNDFWFKCALLPPAGSAPAP